MGHIRVLPDSVINRIAAGEVVERPSAVVKELVENSLDAGARSIEIRIEEGGRRLVEVRDDGDGMDADDAVAALERHATSKLRASSPLDAIETLGFRGEAIPSIAAVSRFTLTTSTGGGSGTRVVVDGGRIVSSAPAAHPRGTTVQAADLFYNTPARRRFLRAPATEMGHIVESVTALALSRPEIRLRLEHGGRRILELAVAPDLLTRLSQIDGASGVRAALPIRAERNGVTASGYILRGEDTGAARGARRFIVNGRVVRDRILSSAAARALEEMLPLGSAASCVLSLSLPPASVDVNVHPAKAEVRFAEPGPIHDLVREAVRQAIGGFRPLRSAPDPETGWSGETARPGGAAPPPAGDLRGRIAEAAAVYMSGHEGAALTVSPRTAVEEAADAPSPEMGVAEAVLPRGAPAVVGHYRNGYILAQDEEGLILVDQHAAHERILFEQLAESEAASGASAPTQALLFPRTVALPPRLRAFSGAFAADLTSLGFEVESFGDDTLVVRGVPAPLGETDPERLVLDLFSDSGEEGGPPSGVEGRRRRMLATAACHAAVKVPAQLTPEKTRWILEKLLACRSALRCPHGRPTMLRWGHRAIERRFGRP